MRLPMGFSAEPVAEAADSDREMFHAALTTESVQVARVLAYGAARHLLRDLRPSPSDVGGLASWLMGGPAPGADDDDEDEPEQVDTTDLETELADPDGDPDEADPSSTLDPEPDEPDEEGA